MNTWTFPLAVASLTLAVSACQTPKKDEKPRTISLVDKSSRTANPVTYTWKASDGETAQLEIWWKEDGSPSAEPLYGEVTAMTLSLGDDKQAVPQSMLSDLWWPELDRITVQSPTKGNYDFSFSGGDTGGSYRVRYQFRQGEFSSRVPAHLPGGGKPW